jgi:TRAP-type C4-dicarboxylate transport system permease small subunit
MPDAASTSRRSIARVAERLAGIATAIAAAALLGLVAVQGWQVIARYVLNDSPSWTEPVTLLLLSTAMSLGAAAGVHARRHFSFSLLADALGPSPRRLLQQLQALTVMLIGAMLAYWGTRLLFDGLTIPTAGVAMPESIDYLPIALGGALMTLFALVQMLAGETAAPDPDAAAAEAD